MRRRGGLSFAGLLLVTGATVAPAAWAQPRTLQDVLAQTYANNPQLQSARAQLRATDEGVPQALAGWRPTVVVGGSYGRGVGTYETNNLQVQNGRDILSAQATLTQPIYRGGQTRASTNRADNQVFAQRGRLLATEQQVMSDTTNAFVNVIQTQQLLELQVNNEQVLARQLQATNDRFRVGEITRTDVAQAEAALAGARAQRETAAGNLQIARATFRRLVGVLPGQLVEPQPLALPVKSATDAAQLAAANNPAVIAAVFDDSAARDAIDVAFSSLMPTLSLQAQAVQNQNSSVRNQTVTGGQVLANFTVPIYQGGSEFSRVRQARQQEQQTRKVLDDTRRQAVQQATQSWEQLVSIRATIQSTRSQISANRVALEGVQREAIVGSRTTLDVLNAEQALLQSRVTLVQNLANLITASYNVANSIGRLTARDLNLAVPLYDEKAYYNAVRQRLGGTDDYATDQPGR
jgi:outer membrane protein